jgi:hypothetical protein
LAKAQSLNFQGKSTNWPKRQKTGLFELDASFWIRGTVFLELLWEIFVAVEALENQSRYGG